MPLDKQSARDIPARLAQRLAAALVQERIVPRFVDTYVVEHLRHTLQVHPTRYRELLGLLLREALLAMTACALAEATSEARRSGAPPGFPKPQTFRRDFLGAMARQQKWSAGDSLEFQSELRLCESLLARRPGAQRSRKPYEAADHPFVDRCAILLDPSFIEQARIASSRALAQIERLALQVTEEVLRAG
ncbi:MAG: hypothetical protein LAN71_12070 [Acidobacteriia bacterium]|nr:hypothetical protein [Terriglobia bacterium]